MEDVYCVKLFSETTTRDEDGKFIVKLLLKDDEDLGEPLDGAALLKGGLMQTLPEIFPKILLHEKVGIYSISLDKGTNEDILPSES